MSTMTGSPVSPMLKLVAPIMAELRELAGKRVCVDGAEVAGAVVNIMVLEQGIEQDSFPPGIKGVASGVVSVSGDAVAATATLGALTEEINPPSGWTKTADGYTRQHNANGTYSVVIEDLLGNTREITYVVSSIVAAFTPSAETPTGQTPGAPTQPAVAGARTANIGNNSTVVDNTAGDEEAGTVAGARMLANNSDAELASAAEGDVLGDSIEETAAPGWLASNWYWILGVIAAGAGLWFIAGLRRRRNEEA